MLTPPKTNAEETVHRWTRATAVEELLASEWLLANERGSYAASTIAGCNTSGYHGLLIGALNPPVNRIMALSNCLEMVIHGRQVFHLSTFDFGEKFTPTGHTHLAAFWRDSGAHFVYDLGTIQVEKGVYLVRDTDTVVIEYNFHGLESAIDLVVRPFVGLRDFHCMQRSHAPLMQEAIEGGVLVRHDVPASCALLMGSDRMRYETDPQWWFNFTYRASRQRGQHDCEDLWTPGFFKGRLERDGHMVFSAHLTERSHGSQLGVVDVEGVKADLAQYRGELIEKAQARDETERLLTLAADQFVVRRRDAGAERSTIVAGYPWFADWGRDAFIALPGLLLATGRYEEARSVLCTFAAAADEGMIPNRFDDRSSTAHFNSVDASLWFVHAAFAYLEATGDRATLAQELLPTIREIIASYHGGTRFDIHADTDGLVSAGDEQTQLTWMDARFQGATFTPRSGKAVEVNALWYNALCCSHEFCLRTGGVAEATRYAEMAQQVGESFCSVFWNERRGYLNDCVAPEGEIDATLRPNQIFAVSLPYRPPLTRSQQKAVVSAVEKALLTPYGLRTLAPHDQAYRGRYEGPQSERDAAYHQGTVWPYLIGPFIEAYLNVHDFSEASRAKASEMIGPLLRHLTAAGCLGSVAEIFDGDEPQRPAGCPAQAWSVGELLRIYRLLQNGKS